MRVATSVLSGAVVALLLPVGVWVGRLLPAAGSAAAAAPPFAREQAAVETGPGASGRALLPAPGLGPATPDGASGAPGPADAPGPASSRLSAAVPKRARAQAVDVTGASRVEAGDHVDVLSLSPGGDGAEAYATTLAQNVLVAAVEPLDAERRRLWLLVIPEEAEALAFAELHGALRVTLRHPDDVDLIEPSRRTTAATLLGGGRVPPAITGCIHRIQVIRRAAP